MPWNVVAPTDSTIIETRYSGVMSPRELEEAIRETIALARTHGRTRFLGDCRELAGGHSVTDLYYFVQSIASLVPPGGLREALLLPALPSSAADVRFWETACCNRGITAKIFTDRPEALDWLTGEQR